MTEQTRQNLRTLRSHLAISFAIAICFQIFAPSSIAPKDWRFLVISGLSFGFGFYGVGFLIPRARFRSFPLTIFVRSLITCLTISVCMTIIIWSGIFISTDRAPLDPEVLKLMGQVATMPFTRIAIVSAFGIALLIDGYFQISRKIGPSVLLNWMIGKYHEPREEERIFMFLDLKDSTPLAEKLGAIRFSRLCQDFFRDLTYPVLQAKGEVSHYIGDEAVITWKPARGLKNANCIECFFIMEKTIAKRASHYMSTYEIVPEFKAGVHIGAVVGAEVGEIKSEIVYHGDVLNTTARITGLCSSLGHDLLISGDLFRRLDANLERSVRRLGEHSLKGKEMPVEIVAIGPGRDLADPDPAQKACSEKLEV